LEVELIEKWEDGIKAEQDDEREGGRMIGWGHVLSSVTHLPMNFQTLLKSNREKVRGMNRNF
jgi:hypothetical protein